MIDKISCERRVGYDIDKYVIALLSALRDGWKPPERVTDGEWEYIRDHKKEYPPELVGYVGYCYSFGGTFFSTYVRGSDPKRNYDRENYNNVMRQALKLEGIEFYEADYLTIPEPEGAVIYCDPPYRGTAKYRGKVFNHSPFYNWCFKMAKKNTVLVSEYAMPDGFTEIWAKELSANFGLGRKAGKRNIEKLYTVI